jgi:hypothetical protein
MRLREIEKVIRARHGNFIPDPDGTDDREQCLNYVRAAALSGSGQDVRHWCPRWAPWIQEAELKAICATTFNRKHMLGADEVAALIGVTWDERVRLGLRTIGACDLSREAREQAAKDRKREKDRVRRKNSRCMQGLQKRKLYEENSLSRLQPWKEEGVSRRTWERRRAASVSRIDSSVNSDALATILSVKRDSLKKTIESSARSISDVAGFGD